jgi:hypothetical protein
MNAMRTLPHQALALVRAASADKTLSVSHFSLFFVDGGRFADRDAEYVALTVSCDGQHLGKYVGALDGLTSATGGLSTDEMPEFWRAAPYSLADQIQAAAASEGLRPEWKQDAVIWQLSVEAVRSHFGEHDDEWLENEVVREFTV